MSTRIRPQAWKKDPIWSDPNVVATYEASGQIVAALIFAPVLSALVWLAFEDDFKPGDGSAVFYWHELRHLKTKTVRELQKIHALKLGAVGLGTKVRQ